MNWPVKDNLVTGNGSNRPIGRDSRHRETNGERIALQWIKDSSENGRKLNVSRSRPDVTRFLCCFFLLFSAANFRVSSIGALTVRLLWAAITGRWEVRRRPEMENVSMYKSERFKVETFFFGEKNGKWPLMAVTGLTYRRPKLKYHRQVAEMFQLIDG